MLLSTTWLFADLTFLVSKSDETVFCEFNNVDEGKPSAAFWSCNFLEARKPTHAWYQGTLFVCWWRQMALWQANGGGLWLVSMRDGHKNTIYNKNVNTVVLRLYCIERQ